MLPLIREQVMAHGWLTDDEILNFIAVSESTPGPFAINISTYVGMETGGLFGAFSATFGVALPSFVIILSVAKCYERFAKNKIIKGCMTGLKPAVIGLIAAAVVSAGQTVLFPGGVSAALFSTLSFITPSFIVSVSVVIIMLILALKKVHPIAIIVLSGLAGIAAGYLC